MRETVLLGCVLLVSLFAIAITDDSDEDEKGCACHINYPKAAGRGGGRYSARVESLEKRIAHVAAEVIDIQKYWENTVVPERQKYKEVTKNLLARVDKLEGSGCEDNHFQCGGDAPQCISNLFVCDGSTECYNGYDEDDRVCKTLLTSGTVFKGFLAKESCTHRKNVDVRLVVGSVTRYAWFKTRAKITGSLIYEYHSKDAEKTDHLSVSGYYDYATRSLVLDSPDEQRYGLSCTFDKFNDDVCQASVHHIYTKESCAEAQLYREKPDTD